MSRLVLRQTGDRIVLSLPRPRARTDGTPLGPDARIELLMTLRDPAPKRARDIELDPSLTWSIPYAEWSAYMQGERVEVGLDLSRIASGLEMETGQAGLRGKKLSFIADVVAGRRARSEPSDIESIDVCEPPAAPPATEARITEDGVLVSWKGSAPAGLSGTPAPAARYGIYRQEEGEPRPDTPLATASGLEWLDRGAVTGRAYRYVIREASARGRCESADSPPVVATRVDLFPPEPPEGLAAVAEHGAIRLFWRPGRESDLRGYRVYRADGADKAWRLLTPADLTATSYTDQDVVAGVVYIYAVTARDGAEPVNESALSDPAVETLDSPVDGDRK